jgi:hypothetical protein
MILNIGDAGQSSQSLQRLQKEAGLTLPELLEFGGA